MVKQITLLDRAHGVRLFRQRFETLPADYFVLDLDDLCTSFDTEAEARRYFDARAALARVRALAGL
jgi:hypothetical protein